MSPIARDLSSLGGAGSATGGVTSYTYDNVYRLTDETKRDSGDDVLYRYQYTHSLRSGQAPDGVGNRLTETNTGQITYTYDNNNKLTQLVGPSGTTTFGYDNNGNTASMTQPGPVTTTYGYNYENRLASVTNPSYTAAYTYSADGLRLRIQESNAQYTDRWFQYDGVRPVLEGTLSGDTYTTTAKYVWEGDSYYSPLVYSMLGGTWRYHFYDGLGSTRQLMLHASPYTVTDTYSYEAFGNLLSSTGTTANPYRYVGSLGYYATGSSLMHLGARYYMPEIGRFLAQDPSGLDDNPYTYVGGATTMSVDPAGLSWRRPPRKPHRLDPYLPPNGADPNEPIIWPFPKPPPVQTFGQCYKNCMSFWLAIISECPNSPPTWAAIVGFAIGCAEACRQNPDSYGPYGPQ